MKLYRQVSTNERMPDKNGQYITDTGFNYTINSKWTDHDDFVDPLWWLEEIEIPNEKQVFELIKEDCKSEFDFYHAGVGASAVISLLKG